jgi:hypothetical protein
MTISRRLADVVKEREIWVHSYRMPPDSNNSIKMEVGIEDCLHIEFEYNKSKCAARLILNHLPLTDVMQYQVPPQGRNSWKNLFSTSPNQD